MYTTRSPQKYKSRPTLYFGMSAALWSGALVAGGVILGALYCLLTHRIAV